MECRKPIAVVLAGAFAMNSFDARYGVKLFTDLPPMSAILASASSSISVSGMTLPFYSTTTDELIEAPAPDQDRSGQS
jgi:hypothetical protein